MLKAFLMSQCSVHKNSKKCHIGKTHDSEFHEANIPQCQEILPGFILFFNLLSIYLSIYVCVCVCVCLSVWVCV